VSSRGNEQSCSMTRRTALQAMQWLERLVTASSHALWLLSRGCANSRVSFETLLQLISGWLVSSSFTWVLRRMSVWSDSVLAAEARKADHASLDTLLLLLLILLNCWRYIVKVRTRSENDVGLSWASAILTDPWSLPVYKLHGCLRITYPPYLHFLLISSEVGFRGVIQ